MIRRQVVIPASPQTVWDALTDPDLLRGWFGGEFEWDLTEGSPLRFRGDDGGWRDGRVGEVRPGSHLRFVWWPTDEAEDASEVSYLLEPADDGVRLTVQERPVERPAEAPTPRAYAVETTSRPESPTWTAWDTRLAGAWAGVAGVGARA